MPKNSLTQTKGRSAAGKIKAAKAEAAAKLMASVASKGKAKKTETAKQQVARDAKRKKLEKLLELDSSDEDEEEDRHSGEDGDDGQVDGEGGDEPEDEPEGESGEDGEGEGDGGDEPKDNDTRKARSSRRAPKKKKNDPPAVCQLRALDIKASLKIRLEWGIEPIYQAIRVLIHHLTEFADATTILVNGLVMVDLGDQGHKPSEIYDTFNEDVMAEMLWPEVCKWLPQIEKHAGVIASDTNLLCHIGEYIAGVAKKTRSDDLPRVKEKVIEIFHIKDNDNELRDKTNRGFNSIAIGRLLCPASDIDEFDDDPLKYCRLAKAGQKLILSEDWPMLCYDERLRDPANPKAGLFRNMAGIKCYKLIFTGRGSAMDEFYKATQRGKTSVAAKAKLEKVTIGSIVHIYLLMHFALNTQPTWQQADGANWDGAAFTRSIFEAAFESPKWAEELEMWKVFGRGQEDTEELESKHKSTALALFKKQSERSMQHQAQAARQHERDVEDCQNTSVEHRGGRKSGGGVNSAIGTKNKADVNGTRSRANPNDRMDGESGHEVDDDHVNDDSARANDDSTRANDDSARANDEPARANDDSTRTNDEPTHANDEPTRVNESCSMRGADLEDDGSLGRHPGKRNPETEAADLSQPPTKRPRPVPRKRMEPSAPLNAEVPPPQSTVRDDVEAMYTD